MPYTITCFGWYMLGKLGDNLEQSSFWPLIDNPFILLYHGVLQLCPVMSFTEVDSTVTFMVYFMNISDQIPSIQVKNKLYWPYQLECWAWRGDCPLPISQSSSQSLCQPCWSFSLWTCQAHACFRVWVPAVPSTLKCSSHNRCLPPHRLSFSLVVPSSKRPSWSTYYSPCNKYHTTLFFFPHHLSLVKLSSVIH